MTAKEKASLREAVAGLGRAIAEGRVTPSTAEIVPGGFLDVMAMVCDRAGLTAEAERVRSWLPFPRASLQSVIDAAPIGGVQ